MNDEEIKKLQKFIIKNCDENKTKELILTGGYHDKIEFKKTLIKIINGVKIYHDVYTYKSVKNRGKSENKLSKWNKKRRIR